MIRDFPMPDLIAEQSRRWLDTPEAERTVATPRPSATVMLLRPAEGGEVGAAVEVFVLRRATGMPFAPGMIAFPGGGVDRRDADESLPWAGPTPQEWAQRLGTDEATARELVCAAAREVFEECGVLLAGPGPDEVVADLTDPSWTQERELLLDRSQGFAELLTRLGLVLRTDLLSLRGHWTTPVCEPRRYDTRFFAARMPEGQLADDTSSEAEVARWATPASVLAAQEQGEEVLLPPTQVMLEQLARLDDLERWLAESGPSPVHPVRPWPAEHSGELWMRTPIDDDGHGVPAPAGGHPVAETPAQPVGGRGWRGGPWGERAHAILCPNPSPMTLEGTNTWVLAEPGSREVVVVDPGPLHEEHLQAVLDHVAERGGRVALTLLTHRHDDHAGSADRWAELTGAPIRGAGRGPELVDGERLSVGGLELVVHLTPGHTADSVCVLLPAEQVLLTGDTVLGRGTTVVAYPDGDLTSYLTSLERLAELTGSGEASSLAPGHGPVVRDAAGTVAHYREHRLARLDQVRRTVAALLQEPEGGDPVGPKGGGRRAGTGPDLADRVMEQVYADVPRAVWPAARQSVLAQLDHLGLLSGPDDAAGPGRSG